MVKYKSIIWGILLTIGITLASSAIAWAEINNKVLFIGSYSHNFESFNKQLVGFKESISKDVNRHIEYYDYGNYPEKENELKFYNLLNYKMKKYNSYDVVVLAEDHAVRFWEKYRDDIFKDIPMVFLGVEEEALLNRILKYDNVYGIKEGIEIETSINLLNKLHPNSSIVALTYKKSSETDRLKDFYTYKDKYKSNQLSHISVGDDGVELAKEKLKNLDEDTVILELYSSKIDEVTYLNLYKIKEFLDDEIHIPKYTTIDFEINSEFIGGFCTDPTKQGNEAAKIVNSIVDGNIPSRKLIEPSEVNSYIFNYDIMRKFGIKEKDLPRNSIIYGMPKSIWADHPEIVIVTMTVLICLCTTIIILIKHSIHRKKYEREILIAKEIAENAHNAQSNFISTISHELRTPVAVIMSCTQLLELNLSKSQNTLNNNSSSINIIKQNCNRMIKIVNNIIDVAKYDSGFMEPKLKNIEIIGFFEYIVEIVVPYANSKNVSIIFDTEVEELVIAVDPYMLERIFLNLVSNSIKFSKEEEGKILINVTTNDKNLVFTVEDNGIGIDEKCLDKIFERFIQLDDTMNRKNEGNGIGLSLVKSLVNLHSGDIHVESQVDMGTIFTVQIPIRVIEDKSVEYHYIEDDTTYSKSTEVEFSDIM